MAANGKNISPINKTSRFSSEVFFGDVVYPPGGWFGPRIQPDYQLVLVHLGDARVKINGESMVILPGRVALMRPGGQEMYHFSQDHQTRHSWCSLNPRLVSPAWKKQLAQMPSISGQSRTLELLMKAAFGLDTWRNAEGYRLLTTLGLAAFQEYGRLSQTGWEGTRRESPSARARHYLEEHFAEENCLRKAAQVAGVTPQHLIRQFRQSYQTTPGRFLWQLRIEQGIGLLTSTGLTTAEIADRCGFKNPFHFSRKLRQMQGFSPRQLRQQSWVL